MRCSILHSADAVAAIGPRWDELARGGEGGLFLSHRWLDAWWRAFHGVDELWLVTVEEDDGVLLGGWPLHLRAPRSGALRVAELRVVGDLGGADRSILCKRGREDEVCAAMVSTLYQTRGWDVLDVPTTSRALGDAMERAITAAGGKFDRSTVTGRPYLDLPRGSEWDEFARARQPQRVVAGAVYAPAEIDVLDGLEELLRLLRKEWAAREAASPAADPQAVTFLTEMVPELHARGLLRMGLVGLDGSGAIAADLVVHDGDRAIQMLRGADPEHVPAGVSEQLTFGSIEEAVQRGARRFEFADEDVPWKSGRGAIDRLRIWNATTAGRLHRGVTAITGAMRAIDPGSKPSIGTGTANSTGAVGGANALSPSRHRPPSGAWRAFDKLRTATPDVVQRAVARVATYSTLHLYRGELFTRNVMEAGELSLSLLTRAQFEAMSESDREAFVTRLDLQEAYCRQKWDRGDTVVLALAQNPRPPEGGAAATRPAGILWCARTPVYVPDIGREVRPGGGECYIHDVYVHPDERGRQVAPAMLDFLARDLRRRDVYRAWALIERTNVASTRAFEKAAYASVADVVYARMGLASRLIVRPPDPEARSFLGLT